MMIGDPKQIERLVNLGIDIEADDIDTSYGALAAKLTQEFVQVETLPLPEGGQNA